MTLRDYLHYNNMTVGEFAEKICVARTYLNSIKTGRYRPSMRLARIIQDATNGQVTVLDLML